MTQGQMLKKLDLPEFKPLFPFRGPWTQTIAARYWPQKRDLKLTQTHQVLLSDGDQLVCLENRPTHWSPSDQILVLVHGLTGCDQSSYMIRLCYKLVQRGYGVIRVNLRGCGSGFGYARHPYHSGRSEDTRTVIQYLKALYPNAPVTQVGFSLGANITLKMAGEAQDSPPGNLKSVIAISPPIDLAESARHLTHERNRFFDQFFVRELRSHVRKTHDHFPDLPSLSLPDELNLIGFDQFYTAPRSGFRDAFDYYHKASSAPLIPKIEIPTLILSSLDDPVVDTRSLQKLPNRAPIDLVLTEKGGHVGFLGWSGKGVRWMDTLILRWIETRKHN
jgi:predicted alpha/beta-fold hydrolase